MCLLQSNSAADEGFEQLRRKGDSNFEKRLARLADEDSVEQEQGLGLCLKTVKCWAKKQHLRGVRKYRIGDHRFFITGRHTDCTYRVRYVMVNKREEDDRAHEEWFQNMILKALGAPDTRTIEVSPETAALENAPQEIV